jgi:HEPN domain-containing protein
MLTRGHLQRLAQVRLTAASLLLDQGHCSGAYYLAGYAAELGLKAVLAGRFRGDEIPDKGFVNSIYTHSLATLVDRAGLKADLEARQRQDQRFATNWEVVKDWNEDSRYEIIPEGDARELLEALSANPASGVFQWIQMHWLNAAKRACGALFKP